MKVAVISCVEPEHLRHCLRALALWVDPTDVIVVDNANTRARSEHVQSVARDAGTHVLRPHDREDGGDTIVFIHEALKAVSASFPDETILKVDEDVLFATEPERIDPGPREFLVPALTINNYTTRSSTRRSTTTSSSGTTRTRARASTTADRCSTSSTAAIRRSSPRSARAAAARRSAAPGGSSAT